MPAKHHHFHITFDNKLFDFLQTFLRTRLVATTFKPFTLTNKLKIFRHIVVRLAFGVCLIWMQSKVCGMSSFCINNNSIRWWHRRRYAIMNYHTNQKFNWLPYNVHSYKLRTQVVSNATARRQTHVSQYMHNSCHLKIDEPKRKLYAKQTTIIWMGICIWKIIIYSWHMKNMSSSMEKNWARHIMRHTFVGCSNRNELRICQPLEYWTLSWKICNRIRSLTIKRLDILFKN